MDLRGNLGGDFFAIDPPTVLYSSGNTGAATVSTSVTDLGALTGVLLEPGRLLELIPGRDERLRLNKDDEIIVLTTHR